MVSHQKDISVSIKEIIGKVTLTITDGKVNLDVDDITTLVNRLTIAQQAAKQLGDLEDKQTTVLKNFDNTPIDFIKK